MPRLSAKQRDLRELRGILADRETAAIIRDVLSDADSDEEGLDEFWLFEHERVKVARFSGRPSSYMKRKNRWMKVLYNTDHTSDNEFLKSFRLYRPEFFRLVELLKDNSAFKAASGKPFRGGTHLHMLILLKFLGAYGNSNSAIGIGMILGLAGGSAYNYLCRAVAAVLKLEDTAITWPDEAERRCIAQRIQAKHGFVNCVGIVDGTLLPLAPKPRHNGEDYYSRKASYAVNALVTCDDGARVRSIVVGWPGSIHDNRVWINSPVALRPAGHFQCNERFRSSNIMIPAFKKPPKTELHPDNNYFNTRLAQVRIKSEHCIGLLKMRFQYLR
ncbi:hypothetical protein PHMEG_00014514 [Phytophthora megakarya]|uniref:DDE Tnp4 domain-containing protein n=1 Tax=Phytophthora megakarya TaxID=4795 RepID=A0A225W3K3_9STRA|nr:hypothetical protein PHMEG_00014514 [Phytophthora megakarya]